MHERYLEMKEQNLCNCTNEIQTIFAHFVGQMRTVVNFGTRGEEKRLFNEFARRFIHRRFDPFTSPWKSTKIAHVSAIELLRKHFRKKFSNEFLFAPKLKKVRSKIAFPWRILKVRNCLRASTECICTHLKVDFRLDE